MAAAKPVDMSRRAILGQAGLLGVAAMPRPAIAAAMSSEALAFTAYRNDSRLGFHRIGFVKDGGRLVVDIEIAVDVKFTIIPLCRYRYRNREIWKDGRLFSMSTETDDKGTAHKVEVGREGDHLLVDYALEAQGQGG